MDRGKKEATEYAKKLLAGKNGYYSTDFNSLVEVLMLGSMDIDAVEQRDAVDRALEINRRTI